MTLVNRLRDAAAIPTGLYAEAADRIEKLEAAIRFMRDNFKDNPIGSFEQLLGVLGNE